MDLDEFKSRLEFVFLDRNCTPRMVVSSIYAFMDISIDILTFLTVNFLFFCLFTEILILHQSGAPFIPFK